LFPFQSYFIFKEDPFYDENIANKILALNALNQFLELPTPTIAQVNDFNTNPNLFEGKKELNDYLASSISLHSLLIIPTEADSVLDVIKLFDDTRDLNYSKPTIICNKNTLLHLNDLSDKTKYFNIITYTTENDIGNHFNKINGLFILLAVDKAYVSNKCILF
jgi:hypothetical protein